MTVHRLVSQGKLALNERGKLALEESLAVLKETGSAGEMDAPDEELGDTAQAPPTSFQKARALKEHYAAQRMKLRFEREQAFGSKKEATCPHCGKSIAR